MGGDLRIAITLLQAAVRRYGTNVTDQSIIEVAQVPPDTVIDDIFKAAYSGKFEKMRSTVKDIVFESFPIQLLLSKILDSVLSSSKFTDVAKAKISMSLALAENALIDGANEYLQISNVSETIFSILNS